MIFNYHAKGPNVEKLRRNGVRALECFPPWIAVNTRVAASFLNIHPQTLLHLAREGVGPISEPRDKYAGGKIYWRLGDLLAWWERLCLEPGKARTYDQIVADWMEQWGDEWWAGRLNYEPPPFRGKRSRYPQPWH